MSKTTRKEKVFKPKNPKKYSPLPPPKLGQYDTGNASY
jgi:hypothetical protein